MLFIHSTEMLKYKQMFTAQAMSPLAGIRFWSQVRSLADVVVGLPGAMADAALAERPRPLLLPLTAEGWGGCSSFGSLSFFICALQEWWQDCLLWLSRLTQGQGAVTEQFKVGDSRLAHQA
jgi:hypothetical protein